MREVFTRPFGRVSLITCTVCFKKYFAPLRAISHRITAGKGILGDKSEPACFTPVPTEIIFTLLRNIASFTKVFDLLSER